MIDRQIGPYTIVAPLGAGGMGEVYRARDSKLGRDVAIKILPSHFTADPERRARFAREARLARDAQSSAHRRDLRAGGIGWRHRAGPRTGRRTDAGRSPRARRLADPEALAIARQIAEALEAAHEKGHRPSRSEAGQHRPARRARRPVERRAREGARLRPGEADGAGCRRGPTAGDVQLVRWHGGRTHSRHAGLHESGAGARPDGRQAYRHLGVRVRALRDADGPPRRSRATRCPTRSSASSSASPTGCALPRDTRVHSHGCSNGACARIRGSACTTSRMRSSTSTMPRRCRRPRPVQTRPRRQVVFGPVAPCCPGWPQSPSLQRSPGSDGSTTARPARSRRSPRS